MRSHLKRKKIIQILMILYLLMKYNKEKIAMRITVIRNKKGFSRKIKGLNDRKYIIAAKTKIVIKNNLLAFRKTNQIILYQIQYHIY
jgi:hypothetical protein